MGAVIWKVLFLSMSLAILETAQVYSAVHKVTLNDLDIGIDERTYKYNHSAAQLSRPPGVLLLRRL